MRSSSLEQATKLGIASPRAYRDMLIHDWYLPDEVVSQTDIYIVRKIAPFTLLNKVDNGELMLKGSPYSVTWINSPSVIKYSDWALLSFRWSKILNRGYVLVKKLTGDDTDFKLFGVD